MCWKYIPNILSSIRIFLALLFPFVANQLLILIGALLTEFLDGYLARKYNWNSLSGQILDPIADKIFALSVGLTFIALHKLTWTQLLLLSIRDIVAAAGFLITIMLLKKINSLNKFRPLVSGKITTVFQYFVFIDLAFSPLPNSLLISVTGLLSLTAALHYILSFQVSLK